MPLAAIISPLYSLSIPDKILRKVDLPEPFIVGGDEVDPACPDCKYPFMVSIQSSWGGHVCGGSLVTSGSS